MQSTHVVFPGVPEHAIAPSDWCGLGLRSFSSACSLNKELTLSSSKGTKDRLCYCPRPGYSLDFSMMNFYNALGALSIVSGEGGGCR